MLRESYLLFSPSERDSWCKWCSSFVQRWYLSSISPLQSCDERQSETNSCREPKCILMLQRVLFLVLIKNCSACMKKYIFLRYASEKTKCNWLSVKDLWCGIYSTYKPGIKLNWAVVFFFVCLFVLSPCRLCHPFIGEQKTTSLFCLFVFSLGLFLHKEICEFCILLKSLEFQG